MTGRSRAQIERDFLAKRDRRKKPDPLPAMLLEQIRPTSPCVNSTGDGVSKDVPFDQRRSMIVRMVDLAKSGIAG